MNSEEEFKDQLRQLIDSKEFPFEEKEWEKARAIIDRSGRKRWAMLFYLSTALLFVGGSAVYMLNPSIGETKKTSPVSANIPGIESERKIVQEQSSSNRIEITQTSPVSNARVNAIAPIAAGHAASNNVAATDKGPERVIHEDQVIHGGDPVIVSPGSDANINVEKQTVTLTNAVLTGSNNEEISQQVTPAENVSVAEPVKTPGIAKANSGSVTSSEDLSVVNDTPPPAQQLNDTSVTTDPGEVIPVIASAVTESAPDSLQQANLQPDTAASNLKLTAPKLMRLSVEGGVTYLNGWKNEGGRDANGINPLIGMNYYYPLVNRVTLSAGIQYNSVGNLEFYSHTSKITRYTTGEESRVTVITPQKLHYLVAPLKLNYAITYVDVVGFGINIAYLLDVTSTMETYDLKLNRRENIKSGKVHGYTEGFKNTDTQFSMFYRRQVYKGLHINGEIMVGATDVKDNKFFGTDSREKNFGFKLSIIYSILYK
jgi:hypothetical protein